MPIQIVDLFAGPGGLGEGFSTLDNGKAFKIAVSAEMEKSAHETLQLRSFFRLIRNEKRDVESYYRFCHGKSRDPYDDRTRAAWKEAADEARQLTLGDSNDDQELDRILNQRLDKKRDWVLIGGPPCQAYSLVGRSRNLGKADYRPEDDHRHFLYREYLRIIQTRQPAVFVMENVKGILSARVGGKKIFHEILRDLSNPNAALGQTKYGKRYRIHSLVNRACYKDGMDPESIDPSDFIIRSEQYGVPQARHRVILLGIREDIGDENFARLKEEPESTVRLALNAIPALRSKLSRAEDTAASWAKTVRQHLKELAKDAARQGLLPLRDALLASEGSVRSDLVTGALSLHRSEQERPQPGTLLSWYHDSKLEAWLNHETRGHMSSDIRRYAYASTFTNLYNVSPKGHEQFILEGLRPNHENWETGKFADRFRVQRYDAPSTTVTSHISKDGHYFIHPDPAQCRSLTVREAARLQTFPDNYFFQGNRTQQFHQVGNAVPPLLAHRMAKIVKGILR